MYNGRKEVPLGILIRNTLAVLPDGNGHAVGRHDLYVEGERHRWHRYHRRGARAL